MIFIIKELYFNASSIRVHVYIGLELIIWLNNY